MIFPSRQPLRRPALIVAVALALATTGCHRRLSDEEKATRAELRQALREGSYARAEELARHVLATAARENGAWERLVRAQIGLRDFAGARQTLVQWRSAVRKPSPKLNEFTGDLAAAEGDVARASQWWQKALAAAPRQVELLRKLLALQQAEHQWSEADVTLTALIRFDDTATDRIARALCRRRLHRWPEAFEDCRRALAMAPDEPDVREGGKLFERLAKFLAEIRDLDARLALTPADDQLLADRALLFLRSEDPDMALEDSAAAAKSAPWAMRPRIFQALALLQLGRTAEAEQLGSTSGLQLETLSPEFLQTVSRIDADISVERSNAELYVARAWQLNDVGQPTFAAADAETALRFDANSAGAQAEIAYAFAKLGRSAEAFEHAQLATKLDPNFSTGWQYRGELEMTQGEFTVAIESFSRALAINQTLIALQKREECYRQVGLIAKAEEDHRALEALNTP